MSPTAPVEQNPGRSTTPPIGVFDSGIGGISIFQAIRTLLPNETVYYLADQAHVPYGARSLAEIRDLSTRITQFLLSKKAKLVVVACNTASAAALQALRAQFPKVPFVGMEPAVKPAAFTTQTGFIGVLATPATFRGAPYGSLLDRFAEKVTVLEDTCPGLVHQIEAGEWDSAKTRRILELAITPMLAKKIDRIVLGCTHYPYVIPMIQSIAGPDVKVIDPAPAIARQTARLLAQHELLNSKPTPAPDLIWTTGDLVRLATFLPELLNQPRPPVDKSPLEPVPGRKVQVKALQWVGDQLIE